MIDIEQADHVEIQVDTTGKLWVNVGEQCQLRIGNVATLQLNLSQDRYISYTQGRLIIACRHVTGTNCWCGKNHDRHKLVHSSRPIEGKFR
jgi:hypothetical protein